MSNNYKSDRKERERKSQKGHFITQMKISHSAFTRPQKLIAPLYILPQVRVAPPCHLAIKRRRSCVLDDCENRARALNNNCFAGC